MKTYLAVVSVGLKKASDFSIITTIEKKQDKRDETDSGHVVYTWERAVNNGSGGDAVN